MKHWKSLGAVPPSALGEARLQIHHAAQLLAVAIGQSLIPARPDDSHTALTWDAAGELWLGQEIPPLSRSAGDPLQAGLRPADLMLMLGEKGLPLAGKTLAEALGWLRRELSLQGRDGELPSLKSPYEIPPHGLAAGARFAAPGAAAVELAAYYGNVHGLLVDLVATRAPETPILTWPHHFDHAILLQLGQRGDDLCSIGIGLSPGDGSYDQPYFYVTPWPVPPAGDLPPLPFGSWRRQGFFGAILTASELLDGEPVGQERRTRAYLSAAINAADKMLAECRLGAEG